MTSEQPPTVPAGRYGGARATVRPTARTRPRRRALAIAAALTAAVGLVAWFSFSQSAADPVTAEMVGFDIVDAEQVDVTFQVHMPAGTTAVCTVDVLSPSYAQVGTLDVAVGPAESRTSAYQVSVGTSELATSADVVGCETTG
ncbi:hypothetical protein GCM10009718_26430 [Isoptericola halotolerans]|uniref:DUF4307 domain-containing protein n=1 Tax=Isoptericola halotolerans TaxID=300560 RepID=A0ABX2A6G0_9MICO|nr:DUF4307 domain-containing protein [Isoptericola halotolerans]NOV97503.1 hypothetical protein [Isoptericola halotolerans]